MQKNVFARPSRARLFSLFVEFVDAALPVLHRAGEKVAVRGHAVEIAVYASRGAFVSRDHDVCIPLRIFSDKFVHKGADPLPKSAGILHSVVVAGVGDKPHREEIGRASCRERV